MKVMKFGGTSIGTSQRIKNVVDLIRDGDQKIVVLSALSGTTNALIHINDLYYAGEKDKAAIAIEELERIYQEHANNLFESTINKKETLCYFKLTFSLIRSFANKPFSMCEALINLSASLFERKEPYKSTSI